MIEIGGKLIDLSGKIPQTKGKYYDPIIRSWSVRWVNEHGKSFDYLILYCANKDGQIIERIYIIPKEEVDKRSGIAVYKKPMNHHGTRPIIPWYEQYRVTDKTIDINLYWARIIA